MLTKTIDRDPIGADEDELDDLKALHRLVEAQGASGLSIVGHSGEEVPVGSAMLRVLRQAVEGLAQDRVVLVSTLTKDFSLDQVADLLDVPYADAVRRVHERGIATHEINGLPLVRFADAMLLKQERDVERHRILDELTRQGQEIQHLLGDRWPGDQS